MNFSISALVAGFIFGIFGYYWFRIAKKEGNVAGMAVTIALMAYPYFVENIYLIWGIGIALLIMAYKLI